MQVQEPQVVRLGKGQNVSLSKTAPLATKLKVNLLWKARETEGKDFDLDASVFMLNEEGIVKTVNDDFVFYHNKESLGGAVKHEGDNRIGGGETIHVDLEKIPAYVQKLVFVVTIDEAKERGQTFGQVDGAAIVLGDTQGTSEWRFDLSEDASMETAMLFAELYRHNGEWKYKAVGQGHNEGLAYFCRQYGLTPT